MKSRSSVLAAALGLHFGCSDLPATTSQEGALRKTEPQENWSHDVVSTDLDIDLDKLTGVATLVVDPGEAPGVSFEAAGLEVSDVFDEDGQVVPFSVRDGRLDVGAHLDQRSKVVVHYAFETHNKLEGLHTSGATFLWPYYCGNLFPCKSSPADGLTFSLSLSGADQARAVYPSTTFGDAPSYMLAWAVGDYQKLALGTTDAGTSVSVYYLPGEQDLARAGTKDLVGVFDWLEKTYGPYSFGSEVASVSADWGDGAFGGMEHHPYWHVSTGSMGDSNTHAHEAAHGWFGDGVRIECWEDLVLSEGTVSYLTARALAAVVGPQEGERTWVDYNRKLDEVILREDRVAWPDTCGGIDVLAELWNSVPYMKGAFFYRAVEAEVGAPALDRAIAAFYADRVGKAATMRDMLTTIEVQTGFDPTPLANAWLRSLGRPDN